jgi:hypothetical protein
LRCTLCCLRLRPAACRAPTTSCVSCDTQGA